MFCKKCLLPLFCLVQGAYFIDIGTKHSDNYGPYDIDVEYVRPIKGPKQKTIGIFNVSVTKQNDDYIGHSNLTLLEHALLEEVKVSVYSIEDTRKSLLWNYRLIKPCAHFAVGPMLEHYLHASNCVIKKGVYIVDSNVSDDTKQFLGTSFFYGDYIFKSYYFTKNANILGVLTKISFKKKKSSN